VMPLAILLLGLLPGFFKNIPGISPTIQGIIADVTGSASAILASGAVTQPNVSTILAAWAGVLAVLKAQANLPASTLNSLVQLEKAVQAALTNDSAAAQSVDWTSIHQITPVA
jgi:hypothetical protein